MSQKHGFEVKLYTKPITKTNLDKLMKTANELYTILQDKKIKRMVFWMEEL